MPNDKFDEIIKSLENGQQPPMPQESSVDSNHQGLQMINEGLKIEHFARKEGISIEISTTDDSSEK